MTGGEIRADNPWRDRVESANWSVVADETNEYGGALLPQFLTPGEAAEIRDLYEGDELFRSTINMGRHRFGEGQYRYFRAPYPEPIERLKQALYPRLLPIARDWWTKLGRPTPWPDTLDEWLQMCHDAGQTKSTAILLKYGEKDWNALHRDLYGDLVFTSRDRPVKSARGWSAALVRHGVSAIRSGERHTHALVFHDAA